MLTRSTGLILFIPFSTTFIQRFWPLRFKWRQYWPEILQKGLASLLIPAGLLLYMLYLFFTTGDALLFSQAEEHWGRHLGLPLYDTITVIRSIIFIPTHRERNLMDLCFTLLPIIFLIKGLKILPTIYIYFSIAIIFFTLLFPLNGPAPLTSDPRYLLILFPCSVLLALWSERSAFFKECWLTISLILFTINVVLFLCSGWVA